MDATKRGALFLALALVLGLLGAPGFGLLLMVHWVLGL